MTSVVWQKNTQNNEWFDFLRLDLSAPYFQQGKKGVFVIWYVAPPAGRVIRVGSGNLAEQLKNLRANPTILEYSKNGPLKVSWVAVNGALKDEQIAGVESFLYIAYTPILGERPVTPKDGPVPVNLIGS